MEINITGLKCDNEYCDYEDMNITFEEYEDYIGSKCPKCNEVLLTEKDYQECLKMIKYVGVGNKIGNVLKWLNPFHYWRLIFGDSRYIFTARIETKKKNL